MNQYYFIFLAVGVVSLISLIGVISLAWGVKKINKYLGFLISFAAGGLLGGAFLHLIPEIFEEGEPLLMSGVILAGIGGFFILEKLLEWRHCHEMDQCERHGVKPLAVVNLVGDGLHNFIDGMIIAAGFLVSSAAGVGVTIAVALHEIPQEIGDFGILLHAGLKRGRALLLNFLSALLAFVGAGVMIWLNAIVEGVVPIMMAVTAGGFIYIAVADLMPEMHKTRTKKQGTGQILILGLGILVMALLLFLE